MIITRENCRVIERHKARNDVKHRPDLDVELRHAQQPLVDSSEVTIPFVLDFLNNPIPGDGPFRRLGEGQLGTITVSQAGVRFNDQLLGQRTVSNIARACRQSRVTIR